MNSAAIILASGSAARQKMLRDAQVDFTAQPADIDEAALQNSMKDHAPQDIALALAQAKAQHIAQQSKEALVIGSDQILEMDGVLFSKAATSDDARDKLHRLRGKTHRLISAVAVARGGQILWSHSAQAHLTMHNFDDAFLQEYLKKAGNVLTSCVGAYALEELGPWLFEKIDGDYHTILGMPLAPLLHYLKTNHQVNL